MRLPGLARNGAVGGGTLRLAGLLALLLSILALVSATASHAQDAAAGSRRAEPRMQLLVPAYFYPAGKGLEDWNRLIEAAKRVPVTAIVNPATGPGEKTDPTYTAVLDRAERGGVRLIGYVSTSYARVPTDQARKDIDVWTRLYPQVRGVFMDEQVSAADRIDYYRELYSHVRRRYPEGRSFSNPGTLCDPGYLTRPATDVACLFENRTGFDALQLPNWARAIGRTRIAALAYQVPDAAQMTRYFAKASKEGIGHFYVTDAAGVNPWDRLPSYWNEEVALVERTNRAAGR
ncbi:MAG: spherulation-specific family 4 protein [Armatimonadota bacterium]